MNEITAVVKTLSFKKKAIIALCALVGVVAIVASSVLATVAYLTSSAAVSNVFTIGDVKMTMYESKVNSDGTLVNPVGSPKDADTNSYHLVPKKTYIKDPTIYVQPGSESSYLFIIARNDISSIEAYNELTMKEQLLINGWMKYGVAATGNIYVYTGMEKSDGWDAKVNGVLTTYAMTADDDTHDEQAAKAAERFAALEALYKDVLAVGVSATDKVVAVDLFEEFTVDEHADVSKFGGAKVEVTAVAIQTAGFGGEGAIVGSAVALEDAWNAVIETYPYIHTGKAQ